MALSTSATSWHKRARPERLSRRESRDGRCYPANRNTRSSSSPSKPGTPGENAAYLKLEKPRFLFLEGSGAVAAMPVAATTALADAPVALASPSAVRAASSTNRPVAGTSAPLAPVPPLRPSATGVGDSTSRGEPAPHRSPLPPPTTTNSLGSSGERAPAARVAGTPRSIAPGAPAAGSSSPSCVWPAPTPIAARRRRPLGLRVWASQTVRRPRSPSIKERTVKIASVRRKGTRKGGKPTHRWGVGEHNE
jgi:hypothetical protein